MKRGLLVLAIVVTSAACSKSQDPEIIPPASVGPSTTSQALQPCPAGGPDATTPPAGCLGEDGAVQRP